jgi:hypothetical protein
MVEMRVFLPCAIHNALRVTEGLAAADHEALVGNPPPRSSDCHSHKPYAN